MRDTRDFGGAKAPPFRCLGPTAWRKKMRDTRDFGGAKAPPGATSGLLRFTRDASRWPMSPLPGLGKS
jgi:hypothetical protein